MEDRSDKSNARENSEFEFRAFEYSNSQLVRPVGKLSGLLFVKGAKKDASPM